MKTIQLWEYVPGLQQETPVLEYYPSKTKKTDATVIVFSGGGYTHRTKKEGEEYALFLNTIGIDAFVCAYRVYPARFPMQLLDARRAVRYVRAYAAEYGIDPQKIAVMGSSAGGHLSALVSTYTEPIEYENVDALDAVCPIPNATILCYPVIHHPDGINVLESGSFVRLADEELYEKISPDLLVNEQTPPAFIWHTSTDDTTVLHSYLYATALKRNNIPHEMHIFHQGGHGLGLADGNTHVAQWKQLLVNWLKAFGWL